MRQSMMGTAFAAMLAMGASLAGSVTVRGETVHDNRRMRPRLRRYAFKVFHPTINRNTGQPHEHKREIARRLRQAERIAAKRAGA